MKESGLYIQYFKNNFFWVFIPVIFFGALGYYFQLKQPVIYKLEGLYEVDSKSEEISRKVVLGDQAVINLRTANLQSDLDIPKEVNFNVFKDGPLGIKMEVSSIDSELLAGQLDKAESYLISKIAVKRVGNLNKVVIYPNLIIGFLIGLGIGGLMGLTASLIKNYCKNF